MKLAKAVPTITPQPETWKPAKDKSTTVTPQTVSQGTITPKVLDVTPQTQETDLR